jgi:AraC-like DNA-binding protein
MNAIDIQRQLDPMLVRLIEKIVESPCGGAAREFIASRNTPVHAWAGREVIEFMTHLRRSTGDDYLGIGSSPCPLGASDFVIDITARSSTLREAITLGFRFMSMATQAVRFSLVERDGWAAIEVREAPSKCDPGHVLADWNLIVWHKLSQWLIGAEIWLDKLEFDHELDAAYSSYAGMFGGCSATFNADCARLVFRTHLLDARVIRTPAEAEWLKVRAPGAFSKTVGLAKPLKLQVRDILQRDLDARRRISTIEDLAHHFGVSSQTLRRRLRDEGTSYRNLKADARCEKALDVLADTGSTVGAASIAAGFAESNALSRALRASRGISSSQLRDSVRGWSRH